MCSHDARALERPGSTGPAGGKTAAIRREQWIVSRFQTSQSPSYSGDSYLDDIPRITAKKYIPTDGRIHSGSTEFCPLQLALADVLKARLKTIGVIEHTFLISQGSNRGVQWKIYDVGGARNQRNAWAPYFEDGRWIFPWKLTPDTDASAHSKRHYISCADFSLRPGS